MKNKIEQIDAAIRALKTGKCGKFTADETEKFIIQSMENIKRLEALNAKLGCNVLDVLEGVDEFGIWRVRTKSKNATVRYLHFYKKGNDDE